MLAALEADEFTRRGGFGLRLRELMEAVEPSVQPAAAPAPAAANAQPSSPPTSHPIYTRGAPGVASSPALASLQANWRASQLIPPRHPPGAIAGNMVDLRSLATLGNMGTGPSAGGSVSNMENFRSPGNIFSAVGTPGIIGPMGGIRGDMGQMGMMRAGSSSALRASTECLPMSPARAGSSISLAHAAQAAQLQQMQVPAVPIHMAARVPIHPQNMPPQVQPPSQPIPLTVQGAPLSLVRASQHKPSPLAVHSFIQPPLVAHYKPQAPAHTSFTQPTPI